MKTFIYTGDQPYNADLNIIKNGKATLLNVRMCKGDAVQLPGDHSTVLSLVRSGLLCQAELVEAPKAPKKSRKFKK